MSKSNKYKTFTELKDSVKSSSVSESRLAYMAKDLDNFVMKIKSSKKYKNY